jgi:hypothetical protein
LAIRSRWNKENEIDVRFPIKKELINQAVLILRCAPPTRIHPETVYSICLGDYALGDASAAPSPSPRSTLIPGPYHVIRLATLQDTGEQVAILDFKVFKSVEALKEHIAKFPWGGAKFIFRGGLDRPEDRDGTTSLLRLQTNSKTSALSMTLL